MSHPPPPNAGYSRLRDESTMMDTDVMGTGAVAPMAVGGMGMQPCNAAANASASSAAASAPITVKLSKIIACEIKVSKPSCVQNAASLALIVCKPLS